MGVGGYQLEGDTTGAHAAGAATAILEASATASAADTAVPGMLTVGVSLSLRTTRRTAARTTKSGPDGPNIPVITFAERSEHSFQPPFKKRM